MAYQCPKCCGDDVMVECTVALRIVYDAADQACPELNDFDQISGAHYDDDSVMVCDNHECEHVGKARDFDLEGNHVEPAPELGR